MKIRHGFVSNSSSNSFIVVADSIEEARRLGAIEEVRRLTSTERIAIREGIERAARGAGISMSRYTHYFDRKPELDKKQFKRFADLVTTLFCNFKVQRIIAWDYDKPETSPQVTSSQIRFNGKGNDGGETFLFPRVCRDNNLDDNGMCIAFCQTDQKPYDTYVTACLILAKLIFKDDINVSSEGSIADWHDGLGLAGKVWDSDIEIEFDEGLLVATSESTKVEIAKHIKAQQMANAEEEKKQKTEEEKKLKEKIETDQWVQESEVAELLE